MYISAKFQLYPPYGFGGDGFLIFFHKFSISVAMATNQIQRLMDSNDMFGIELLKVYFCKTFVKISAVR